MFSPMFSILLIDSITRGIPTSLIKLNTAAIIGLGISKIGWHEIIKRASIKRMLTIWLIAPLTAFVLSFILTALAHKIRLL